MWLVSSINWSQYPAWHAPPSEDRAIYEAGNQPSPDTESGISLTLRLSFQTPQLVLEVNLLSEPQPATIFCHAAACPFTPLIWLCSSFMILCNLMCQLLGLVSVLWSMIIGRCWRWCWEWSQPWHQPVTLLRESFCHCYRHCHHSLLMSARFQSSAF